MSNIVRPEWQISKSEKLFARIAQQSDGLGKLCDALSYACRNIEHVARLNFASG